MRARTIAKQVAYGRIAIGAALLVKPDLVPAAGSARSPSRRAAGVLAVTFGARDLAVGAGAAYALHSGGSARPWLLAATFTDAVDAVATAAARRSLPSPGGPGTVALAGVGAAVGAWTASQLSADAVEHARPDRRQRLGDGLARRLGRCRPSERFR